MKCEICGKGVKETFLKKIVGTYVKDAKGRKRAVCFECQKLYPKKDTLLEQVS